MSSGFYIIFYRSLFHQIEEVRKELAGQFVLKLEFESTSGDFRFFRILPDFLDRSPLSYKMGNSWSQDWEIWTKERIEKFDKELPLIQMIGEGSVGTDFASMFTTFINNKLEPIPEIFAPIRLSILHNC